jgi:hypothetical protein
VRHHIPLPPPHKVPAFNFCRNPRAFGRELSKQPLRLMEGQRASVIVMSASLWFRFLRTCGPRLPPRWKHYPHRYGKFFVLSPTDGQEVFSDIHGLHKPKHTRLFRH